MDDLVEIVKNSILKGFDDTISLVDACILDLDAAIHIKHIQFLETIKNVLSLSRKFYIRGGLTDSEAHSITLNTDQALLFIFSDKLLESLRCIDNMKAIINSKMDM